MKLLIHKEPVTIVTESPEKIFLNNKRIVIISFDKCRGSSSPEKLIERLNTSAESNHFLKCLVVSLTVAIVSSFGFRQGNTTERETIPSCMSLLNQCRNLY